MINTYDLQGIFDFMHKRLDVPSHDPVRILDMLFKRTLRAEMINIKNLSHLEHERLDDLGVVRDFASDFYRAVVLDEAARR